MLTNLVSFKGVVDFMYGNMSETRHLRDRCPQPATWTVAELLAKELDYPCKVVVKAQDQGHWFLSDAIHRCANLWKHMSIELDKVEAQEDETEDPDEEVTE